MGGGREASVMLSAVCAFPHFSTAICTAEAIQSHPEPMQSVNTPPPGSLVPILFNPFDTFGWLALAAAARVAPFHYSRSESRTLSFGCDLMRPAGHLVVRHKKREGAEVGQGLPAVLPGY